MKFLIAILLATQLTGCFYQNVNSFDISRANQVCEKLNSKVMGINSYFDGSETMFCENGAGFNLWGSDTINILKEKQ